MNEFFKVENDVLSIADNINNKTRLAVDSLTKNQQNIDTYTRLIMKKIYDSLEMNIDEIGMKNSIYEKICRAFYNNALRPEAMLYNGKIVANIITIGIAEHRVIISLNSDEIYLYDSYVTTENLSDLIYRNLQTKEQSNVKPEDLGPTIGKLVVIVKGKMVIIDNVRPCSSISFGFPDKVNGYRDLFRTSYDKF